VSLDHIPAAECFPHSRCIERLRTCFTAKGFFGCPPLSRACIAVIPSVLWFTSRRICLLLQPPTCRLKLEKCRRAEVPPTPREEVPQGAETNKVVVKSVDPHAEETVVELDEWLIDFANLFRENLGIDPDKCAPQSSSFLLLSFASFFRDPCGSNACVVACLYLANRPSHCHRSRPMPPTLN
jgi:hypothetical protein